MYYSLCMKYLLRRVYLWRNPKVTTVIVEKTED